MIEARSPKVSESDTSAPDHAQPRDCRVKTCPSLTPVDFELNEQETLAFTVSKLVATLLANNRDFQETPRLLPQRHPDTNARRKDEFLQSRLGTHAITQRRRLCATLRRTILNGAACCDRTRRARTAAQATPRLRAPSADATRLCVAYAVAL